MTSYSFYKKAICNKVLMVSALLCSTQIVHAADVTTNDLVINGGATIILNKNNAGNKYTVPTLTVDSDQGNVFQVEFTAANDTTTTAGHGVFIESISASFPGKFEILGNINNNKQNLYVETPSSVALGTLSIQSADNNLVLNGSSGQSTAQMTLTSALEAVSGAKIHLIKQKLDLGTASTSGSGLSVTVNFMSHGSGIPELDLGNASQLSVFNPVIISELPGYIHTPEVVDPMTNITTSPATGDVIGASATRGILGFHVDNFTLVPGVGILANQSAIREIKAYNGATVRIEAQ